MNDIIVENDLIPQWLARHPFCNVCNKPVEEIEIKYNPEFKHIFGSNPKYSPGRYTTYTIRCHGEQISMDYDNIKKEWIHNGHIFIKERLSELNLLRNKNLE